MDGTMAGKVISGDDPSTRGNTARRVISKTVSDFSSQFNWGLETFEIGGGPAPYNTHSSFLCDGTPHGLTNHCAAGVSGSEGGPRPPSDPPPRQGQSLVA